MNSTGLEPAIPAVKRHKAYALYPTATGTHHKNFVALKEIKKRLIIKRNVY
jgi:hypothetical protein